MDVTIYRDLSPGLPELMNATYIIERDSQKLPIGRVTFFAGHVEEGRYEPLTSTDITAMLGRLLQVLNEGDVILTPPDEIPVRSRKDIKDLLKRTPSLDPDGTLSALVDIN